MSKKETVLEVTGEKITLKSEKAFEPKEYYKNRKGLYVFFSFKESILKKAESTRAGKEFSVSAFTIKKNATDKQIEADLVVDHNFNESDVCAVIAELIAKQLKGKDGALLINGNWNLFYTSAFVVDVYWNGDEWYVRTWKRDVIRWHAGYRVFSPAN